MSSSRHRNSTDSTSGPIDRLSGGARRAVDLVESLLASWADLRADTEDQALWSTRAVLVGNVQYEDLCAHVHRELGVRLPATPAPMQRSVREVAETVCERLPRNCRGETVVDVFALIEDLTHEHVPTMEVFEPVLGLEHRLESLAALDSLDLVGYLCALEERLGVEFWATDVTGEATFLQLAQAVWTGRNRGQHPPG